MIESCLELPSGATILDCPCGCGRHSLELAKRGYNITGVDLCPQFISEAKQKTEVLSKKAKNHFLQADMRFLPKELKDFDACLNMFLSFGYFDNDDDNYLVLRELYRLLRPEGKLLIHSDVNPDRIKSGSYGDRSVRMLRRGGRLFIEENFNVARKRLEGRWTVATNDNGRISHTYSVRIYEHDEMITLLRTSGFSAVRILFPVSPSLLSHRLPQEVVYVATK